MSRESAVTLNQSDGEIHEIYNSLSNSEEVNEEGDGKEKGGLNPSDDHIPLSLPTPATTSHDSSGWKQHKDLGVISVVSYSTIPLKETHQELMRLESIPIVEPLLKTSKKQFDWNTLTTLFSGQHKRSPMIHGGGKERLPFSGLSFFFTFA